MNAVEKNIMKVLPKKGSMNAVEISSKIKGSTNNKVLANLMMLAMKRKIKQVPVLERDKMLGPPLNSRFERIKR